MATKFEELVSGMVNVGVGAAALTAEKGKEVLENLSAKGAEVRGDQTTPDFAHAMSDVFQKAGGAFTDLTDRLSVSGSGVAERILDELIVARVRGLSTTERQAFLEHVQQLIEDADTAVEVEVESCDASCAEDANDDGASR